MWVSAGINVSLYTRLGILYALGCLLDFMILHISIEGLKNIRLPSTPALRSHGFAKTNFTHLISLYFGGDSSVVNDLWGQKVKLDVGVCYFGTTTNKSSAFHVGCCSITLWEIDVVSEMIVIFIRQTCLFTRNVTGVMWLMSFFSGSESSFDYLSWLSPTTRNQAVNIIYQDHQ